MAQTPKPFPGGTKVEIMAESSKYRGMTGTVMASSDWVEGQIGYMVQIMVGYHVEQATFEHRQLRQLK